MFTILIWSMVERAILSSSFRKYSWHSTNIKLILGFSVLEGDDKSDASGYGS
jgi:hypothetical protein